VGIIAGIGKPWRAIALVIVGAAGGESCSTLQVIGTPGPKEANLRWNQTGPTGPTGATGARGLTGSLGPRGPTNTVVSGQTLTLSGGNVITVGGSGGLTIASPVVRNTDSPLGGVVLSTTSTALKFNLLAVALTPNTQTSATGQSSGHRGGISITKTIDKSSAKLLQACATGQHFKTAVITVRGNGSKHTALTYSLTNVIVTSDQIHTTGKSSAHPQETLTIGYASIKISNGKPK
jgi:hypothetical protein